MDTPLNDRLRELTELHLERQREAWGNELDAAAIERRAHDCAVEQLLEEAVLDLHLWRVAHHPEVQAAIAVARKARNPDIAGLRAAKERGLPTPKPMFYNLVARAEAVGDEPKVLRND